MPAPLLKQKSVKPAKELKTIKQQMKQKPKQL
jgi:hypothetical protein